MAGNQVRGLVAVSKARGWDPTVIPGVGSIANFDYDHGNYPMGSVGSLPDGENLSWPDGYDVPALKMDPFPGPDVSREVERDRTNNSNPYPGFPNGSY